MEIVEGADKLRVCSANKTKAVFSDRTITVISNETFIDEQTQDYDVTPPVCEVKHEVMNEFTMSVLGLIHQLRQVEAI